MSDPKRATLITVAGSKSEKNKVNKTVRLTINLDESNESKYPELNYKELVITEERKHKVQVQQNGKPNGLNPFSDNDDDVERVARKFEQKYGGKSTYGRKGRSKHDDFADIGAGYDENDSFIDNTDGYDEMIPPECDTLYGGFYINSGSLEFKNVDAPPSDDEGPRGRRNKRRISSSSSSAECMDSSSQSDSADRPEGEHRNKKNKEEGKKQAKKIRRTDSSAANSGKQTSDDAAGGEAESADSRTSHSDSLTSKPAPSSENPATSDSSRDVESKTESKLPAQVVSALEELESVVAEKPTLGYKEMMPLTDPLVLRLERSLGASGAARGPRRAAWARAAACLRVSRTALLQRARKLLQPGTTNNTQNTSQAPPAPQPTSNPTATNATATNPTGATTHSNKRKHNDGLEDFDPKTLNEEQREAKVTETLSKLKALIEEKRPGMIASYNAECERVQEERKKLQIASAAEGAPQGECTKRMPKRRFPWCPRSRSLLARLVKLSRDQDSAAVLLAKRALPMFPSGFVRMPTLLRQADLNKELKVSDIKRHRANSSSHLYPQTQPATVAPPTQQFSEPIHFPPSLTVTTMKPSPEKNEVTATDDKERDKKITSVFGNIVNTFSLSKDLVIETQEETKNEDLYIPPNNIGSITITPVPNNTQKPEKKANNVIVNDVKQHDGGLIRVKSPAALNEMVNKQEKSKALENIHKQEKNKALDTIHKQEKNKALDNIHKQEKNKALENIHKQEKNKAVDNIHKQEKNKAVDNIHKQEKNKALENIHKQEKNKVLDTIHKQEKNKALENIHKRDKDKHKKEKSHHHNHTKEKSLILPLQIDTNFQPKQKTPNPSPKNKEEVSQKHTENLRIDERNIPRPALIPVHHSPTFAKPDKRPPEVKKKKEVLIVSDVDPLAVDPNEPVAVDDSSSDVEVVEDKSDTVKSDSVPCKVNQVNKDTHKDSGKKDSDKRSEKLDEATKEDFDSVMKNLRDLEHSQEATKYNSSSYGGVITSAKRDKASIELDARTIFGDARSDKDKLTNFFEQNGWM